SRSSSRIEPGRRERSCTSTTSGSRGSRTRWSSFFNAGHTFHRVRRQPQEVPWYGGRRRSVVPLGQPVGELGPARLHLRDDLAQVDLELGEPAVAVVVCLRAQLVG